VEDWRNWRKSLVKVRIYVEGGGDAGSTKAACREGFRSLFQKLGSLSQNPTVIASGGRLKAFENFYDALAKNTDEMIVLLVDAERPVRKDVWAHLGAAPDGWQKPNMATEEQAHLMVQSMEAWFIADKEALGKYYGQGFHVNSLPARQNVEDIPKADLVPALKRASRATTKGEYHKTAHGYTLLAFISPAKVRQKSPHAERLFHTLEVLSRAEPEA
jgi:hypothetical protein